MKRISIANVAVICSVLALCSSVLYAQGVRKFELDIPKESKLQKINSPYATLEILDTRYDTTHLGFSMNSMGGNLIIVPKTPLNEQLQTLFHTLKNPSTGGTGEVAIAYAKI